MIPNIRIQVLRHCCDAEHFVALCRRELKLHPRSPIVTSPKVAKDIDMSGILKMSADEIDAALLAEVA